MGRQPPDFILGLAVTQGAEGLFTMVEARTIPRGQTLVTAPWTGMTSWRLDTFPSMPDPSILRPTPRDEVTSIWRSWPSLINGDPSPSARTTQLLGPTVLTDEPRWISILRALPAGVGSGIAAWADRGTLKRMRSAHLIAKANTPTRLINTLRPWWRYVLHPSKRGETITLDVYGTTEELAALQSATEDHARRYGTHWQLVIRPLVDTTLPSIAAFFEHTLNNLPGSGYLLKNLDARARAEYVARRLNEWL